ncbi:MAG: LemA family protein [Phycisphaerales bacterium]|nr:MAG: LemA family protein [Phycisphaerales bacterium]
MSRIGVIVRRLYGEDLKPSGHVNEAGTAMNANPSRRKAKFAALKKTLGSQRTAFWAIKIAVILLVLFMIAEAFFQFNRFAAWQTKVMARQADVEREYQRRENLIPNLVYAVSRYAVYEQDVFKHVSDVRAELMKIQNSEIPQSQIGSLMEKTLSRLVAWAEQYPDLKATQSVQDLIKEAANTEDRIAEAKKEYNKDCEIYNQYLSVFPGNVFAFVYRFKTIPYMGLEDVNVPVIDLDMTEGAEE